MAFGNYYVAMLDLLGFSHRIASTRLEQVSKEYRDLLQITNVSKVPSIATVFSDTILLWQDVDERVAGWSQADLMREWFGYVVQILMGALWLNHPMRVGIAFGRCEIDPRDRVFLGQPIVDAFQTEQAQAWVGGACHDSCRGGPGFDHVCLGKLQDVYLRRGPISLVVEYPVPVKPEWAVRVPHLDLACNWITFGVWSDNPELGREKLAGHEAAAPVEARSKWKSALAFAEAAWMAL